MWEHGEIARNLNTGHGFAMHWPYPSQDSARIAIQRLPPKYEGSFMPPVNPYLIFGMYSLFGMNKNAALALMLFYAIMSSLIPLVVYKSGLLLFDERSARLSAIISTFFLPGAYAVVTFSGSPLYQLLAVSVLYYGVLSTQTPTLRSFFLLGVCSGVLVLLRSEFLALSFILISVAIFFAARKHRKRDILRYGLLSLSVCSVIIAPWTIRNYNLFHQFVPVVDHPWHEIWRGNNVYATASNYDSKGNVFWENAAQFPSIINGLDRLPYDQSFDLKADSIFHREAVSFIENNPLQCAGLGVKKIVEFVTVDFHHPDTKNPFYSVFMLGISFLTIFGALQLFRKSKETRNFAAPVLYGVFFLYYLAILVSTFMLPRYQIYVFTAVLATTGGINRKH